MCCVFIPKTYEITAEEPVLLQKHNNAFFQFCFETGLL